MEKKKITKKIFWEKMGNLETRKAFFEELEKNKLLGEKIRIHFVSMQYVIGSDMLDLKNTDITANGLILRCLHNAIGDELFFSYLEEYQGQIITLSVKQLLNIKIFLSHISGTNYMVLAEKYNLSYDNIRQICNRVAKFFS